MKGFLKLTRFPYSATNESSVNETERNCALMDSEVIARIAQMREASTNINAGASKIKDAVDQTNKEVSALGPDRYMSPGADSFRANYARLTPRLEEAYQQLIAFQKRLSEAADEIEAAAGSTS
ncbi:MAG: hypothetical protein CL610_14100 [Anaerolineaceae bacterium]|nr:hypothetical protein [Anaerolineaceae bacterium]